MRNAVVGLLAAVVLSVPALAADLVPVGKAVGISVTIDGAMVAGISEVETAGGKVSPAGQAGVLPGDIIIRLGSEEVHCLSDLAESVSTLDGGAVTVTVLREDGQKQFTLTPALSCEGRYQLGLWLRDSVTGIGTITYYDPETGNYGALGHGINDVDTGRLLPVRDGSIYHASVIGVVRGQPGTPGELTGSFEGEGTCGTICGNTVFGIFGTCEGVAGTGGDTVTSAEYGEARPGEAAILSNIRGEEVEEFSIQIDRVYRENGEERFSITVTDPDLLAATGGIVQGMSGSPILQDGKLVGAVTHVLTGDPARGYGLGISSMLSAGQETSEAAA